MAELRLGKASVVGGIEHRGKRGKRGNQVVSRPASNSPTTCTSVTFGFSNEFASLKSSPSFSRFSAPILFSKDFPCPETPDTQTQIENHNSTVISCTTRHLSHKSRDKVCLYQMLTYSSSHRKSLDYRRTRANMATKSARRSPSLSNSTGRDTSRPSHKRLTCLATLRLSTPPCTASNACRERITSHSSAL